MMMLIWRMLLGLVMMVMMVCLMRIMVRMEQTKRVHLRRLLIQLSVQIKLLLLLRHWERRCVGGDARNLIDPRRHSQQSIVHKAIRKRIIGVRIARHRLIAIQAYIQVVVAIAVGKINVSRADAYLHTRNADVLHAKVVH